MDNKIDLVKKSKMLETFATLSNLGFIDIIPISALQNEGVEKLKKFLLLLTIVFLQRINPQNC